MTVAIAALCGWPSDQMVVCAEDHMLTAGDVEFEQPQPKIWRLAPSCIAMIFGDTIAQTEIALRTERLVSAAGPATVQEIAEQYTREFRAYVRRRAEAAILAPLGLTVESFAATQASMHPDLVKSLAQEMRHFYIKSGLDDVLGGALIAGADAMGAHIYRVRDGESDYMNQVGFVAAGSGQWHAESQFMFSRYIKEWQFPEALSLVYAAKKRAEVAPGVGTETDIVVITTRPPGLSHVKSHEPLMTTLDGIYQRSRAAMDAAQRRQHGEVRAMIDSLLHRPPSAVGAQLEQSAPSSQSDQQAHAKTKRGRKRQPPSPE